MSSSANPRLMLKPSSAPTGPLLPKRAVVSETGEGMLNRQSLRNKTTNWQERIWSLNA